MAVNQGHIPQGVREFPIGLVESLSDPVVEDPLASDRAVTDQPLNEFYDFARSWGELGQDLGQIRSVDSLQLSCILLNPILRSGKLFNGRAKCLKDHLSELGHLMRGDHFQKFGKLQHVLDLVGYPSLQLKVAEGLVVDHDLIVGKLPLREVRRKANVSFPLRVL